MDTPRVASVSASNTTSSSSNLTPTAPASSAVTTTRIVPLTRTGRAAVRPSPETTSAADWTRRSKSRTDRGLRFLHGPLSHSKILGSHGFDELVPSVVFIAVRIASMYNTVRFIDCAKRWIWESRYYLFTESPALRSGILSGRSKRLLLKLPVSASQV